MSSSEKRAHTHLLPLCAGGEEGDERVAYSKTGGHEGDVIKKGICALLQDVACQEKDAAVVEQLVALFYRSRGLGRGLLLRRHGRAKGKGSGWYARRGDGRAGTCTREGSTACTHSL